MGSETCTRVQCEMENLLTSRQKFGKIQRDSDHGFDFSRGSFVRGLGGKLGVWRGKDILPHLPRPHDQPEVVRPPRSICAGVMV